jgi:hypothetical protein
MIYNLSRLVMNKNQMLTVFLVAVLCQPVSASDFVYKCIHSVVLSNYKAIGTGFLLYGGYKQIKKVYNGCLFKNSIRLISDVEIALNLQNNARSLCSPCDSRTIMPGKLDARDYPFFVFKETVQLANNYIFQKNLLLKSGISCEETIRIKNNINQTLAVLINHLNKKMDGFDGNGVVLGLLLRDSLKFETFA